MPHVSGLRAASPEIVLRVQGLRVAFRTSAGLVQAVRGVDFEVGVGETVALVGESGSGKSASVLGMLGLFPPESALVRAESLEFEGAAIVDADRSALRSLLGRRIGVVFQDPQSSLNPTMRVGRQIGEVIRLHEHRSRSEVKARVLTVLEEVGIPDPPGCARAYPHQLSGGMRQRAMIAMATIASPSLLIADEPTTALDVTLQAQVIDLLRELQRRHGSGILFVTHDLSLVSEFADRIIVMYAGRIVESGRAAAVVDRPLHPYTRALMASVPTIEGRVVLPIRGRPPDPQALPSGCAFHPRCEYADDRCAKLAPPTFKLANGRESRCWLAEGVDPAC